jgi:hypothetical protein
MNGARQSHTLERSASRPRRFPGEGFTILNALVTVTETFRRSTTSGFGLLFGRRQCGTGTHFCQPRRAGSGPLIWECWPAAVNEYSELRSIL